jgi:DNA-binding NtrC family response regulator
MFEFLSKRELFPEFHKRPYQVLIVEDDYSLEDVITNILYGMYPDMEYTWVSTVEAARVELDTNPCDLILSDLILFGKESGMDLWDTCLKCCPQIPFIMMSGMGRERFYEAVGSCEVAPLFISKPLMANECKQLIRASLRGWQ